MSLRRGGRRRDGHGPAGAALALALAGAAAVAPALPASGAGLDLSWGACGAPAGTAAARFDCANPDSVLRLFGTFRVPETAEGVVAADIVLELEAETGELPPFWQFEADRCNRAGIVFSAAPPAAGCDGALSPWGPLGAAATPFVLAYVPDPKDPRRARLACGIARRSDDPTTLVAGAEYFGFELRFFGDAAREAGGPCAGCGAGLRIQWSSATFHRVDPATAGRRPAPDDPRPAAVVLTGPGERSNCVRVNGAGKDPCASRGPEPAPARKSRRR